MPRRGTQFLGPMERARARARERRRKVFILLLEGVGLSGIIGLFPPLRGMWVVTGVLLVLLVAYVWLLLQLRVRQEAPARPAPQDEDVVLPPAPVEPSPEVRPGEPRIVVIRNADVPPRRAGVAG